MANIEDCLMTGFASGIVDQRGAGVLKVANTTIRNMSGSGVNINATKVMLSDVRVINAANGIVAGGASVAMMVSRSVIQDNSAAGLLVAVGQVDVDSSVIAHNGTGASVGGGATLRLSNSDVVFNTTGVSGTVNSYSNNRFVGNGAGGTISAITPAGTTPSGQQ